MYVQLDLRHIERMSVLKYPLALNSYQFKLLGMNWPPRHGWIGKLLGLEIPRELYELVCELRGKTKPERKVILARRGISACRLFHNKKMPRRFMLPVPEDYAI